MYELVGGGIKRSRPTGSTVTASTASSNHSNRRGPRRFFIGASDDGRDRTLAGAGPTRSRPDAARRSCPCPGSSPHHDRGRSEEHTSELQSLMRNSYAVFCLKKKNITHTQENEQHTNIN